MIKQLASKDVEDYIKNNPKSVLLDVRTKEEWSKGKPDGDKVGLKVPASKYREDMSTHMLFGTDKRIPKHQRDYQDKA